MEVLKTLIKKPKKTLKVLSGKSKYNKDKKDKIKAISLWTGNVTKRVIQIDIPLYILTDTVNPQFTYTLNDAANTQRYNLFTGLYAHPLFNQMLQDWSYYQITGIKFQFQRAFTENPGPLGLGTVLSMPPVSITPVGVGTGMTFADFYNLDNAFKTQVIQSDSNSYSNFYRFPTVNVDPSFADQELLPWLGSFVWQTQRYSQVTAAEFYCCLGFPYFGQMTAIADGAVNLFRRVGTFRCSVFTKWCMPKISST